MEVGNDMTRLQSLEKRSSTLFLVAAGLMVVHTVIHALIAFTNFTYPLHHEMPFGVVGHMLAFIALLGLYPQFVTRSPKLTRAGAGFAVLGTVGWFVIGMMTLSENLGVSLPAWLGVFAPLTILTVILGYLAFGIAGLRTDIVTRTTALVVLTPVLVMIYNMAVALTTGGTQEGQVIVAGGFALTHLAIGAALRSDEFPTTGPGPTASPAT
ncbi:MAG: hypothetical protein ABEH59_08180 [Halobacteriales archaeon]